MTCKLCLSEKTLVNSHIIPEFCYKPLYDERHRLNELHTDPSVRDRCFLQKGVREKLLCLDCEHIISPSEKYVREVLYGGVVNERYVANNIIHLSLIDYAKLKLFQLSILWRASVSSHEFFKNVSLGDYDEAIRKMILSGDPGTPYQFPCAMNSIVTGDGKLDVVDGFIWSPDKMIQNGQVLYRFFFGGSMWMFFATDDASWFTHKYLFPSEDGKVQIPMMKAEDTEFFVELGKDLLRKKKNE